MLKRAGRPVSHIVDEVSTATVRTVAAIMHFYNNWIFIQSQGHLAKAIVPSLISVIAALARPMVAGAVTGTDTIYHCRVCRDKPR